MSEFYTAQELHDLTRYARAKQQAEWLRAHGIPFRQEGNRVIVSRVHGRAWLEGRNIVSSNGLNMAGIK